MRSVPLLLVCLLAAALAVSGCNTGVGTRRPGSSRGGEDGGTPMPGAELCNGLDDDGNGQVDESCSCSAGATQGCWPGDPARRGRGVCADGVQTCSGGAGEFGAWDACSGATLPSTEIAGNCIDEDCDGLSPGCREACSEFEVCGNGVDDECDGLADCADPDCPCPVDCAATPEACTCTDRCLPGTERFCDEPEFCAWGVQLCAPDGSWGACLETSRVPPECARPIPFIGRTIYDPECCVRVGLCCQNFGYDSSLDIDANVGNCDPLVERVCVPM